MNLVGDSVVSLTNIGENDQGVIGLRVTGMPHAHTPNLSMRFVGRTRVRTSTVAVPIETGPPSVLAAEFASGMNTAASADLALLLQTMPAVARFTCPAGLDL